MNKCAYLVPINMCLYFVHYLSFLTLLLCFFSLIFLISSKESNSSILSNASMLLVISRTVFLKYFQTNNFYFSKKLAYPEADIPAALLTNHLSHIFSDSLFFYIASPGHRDETSGSAAPSLCSDAGFVHSDK